MISADSWRYCFRWASECGWKVNPVEFAKYLRIEDRPIPEDVRIFIAASLEDYVRRLERRREGKPGAPPRYFTFHNVRARYILAETIRYREEGLKAAGKRILRAVRNDTFAALADECEIPPKRQGRNGRAKTQKEERKAAILRALADEHGVSLKELAILRALADEYSVSFEELADIKKTSKISAAERARDWYAKERKMTDDQLRRLITANNKLRRAKKALAKPGD